jgi:hypothetical protein
MPLEAGAWAVRAPAAGRLPAQDAAGTAVDAAARARERHRRGLALTAVCGDGGAVISILSVSVVID